MAAILKSNEGPEMETSDLLSPAAPQKLHTSWLDEPEDVEQLKETSEPRNTKRVPLDRAEAGLTDMVRFPRSPEGKRRDILTPGLPLVKRQVVPK